MRKVACERCVASEESMSFYTMQLLFSNQQDSFHSSDIREDVL